MPVLKIFAVGAASALLLSGLGMTGAHAAAPVADFYNGGFETPLVSGGPTAEFGYRQFEAGADIGGWEVVSGNVDLVTAPYAVRTGNQALDLNGLEAGAITQTFSTTPGELYSVFYWVNTNGGESWRIEMSVDGVVFVAGDGGYMNGQAHEVVNGWERWGPPDMTASGTSMTVTLISLDSGFGGVVLDDVTVTTPEKATLSQGSSSQGNYTNKNVTVNLHALLTSNDPACLAGRTVTFALNNGMTATGITDASGKAAGKFTGLVAGVDYTGTATVTADEARDCSAAQTDLSYRYDLPKNTKK